MGDNRPSQWVVSVFGSTRRSGPWQPGRRVRAVAVFGSCHLDLRNVEGEDGETDVWALALFGDVRIIVPEDSLVELSGVAIFGDRRSVVAGPSSPGAMRVKVDGVALCGDVDVLDSVGASS